VQHIRVSKLFQLLWRKVRPSVTGILNDFRTEASATSRFSFIPSKNLNEISKLGFVSNHPRIKLQIHAPFKWAQLQAAFHSVFSGSTDRLPGHTPRVDEICKFINLISVYTPVNLISVIGGNYYLDLINKLEIDRLILFDSNYLEIVKTSFLLEAFNRDDDPSNFGSETERRVSQYMKTITTQSGVDIEFEQLASSKWKHHGYERKSFPILLETDHYPRHAFPFHKEEARGLSKKLLRAIRTDFWLDLPRINMNREFVVVFVSNCRKEDLSDLDIRIRIVNHSGLVIIRSNDDGSKENINDHALEPHPFWMAVLSSCLNVEGTHLRAVEILPPELRKLTNLEYQISNNNFDAFFCEEVAILGEPLTVELSNVQSIVTHILIGKIKSGTELNYRIDLVRTLFLNIPTNISRIVICEFHPDSTRSSHLKPEIDSMQTLTTIYKKMLSGFTLSETRHSPGFLEEKRNVFLVFDRAENT
jgi:hypothetical protein